MIVVTQIILLLTEREASFINLDKTRATKKKSLIVFVELFVFNF